MTTLSNWRWVGAGWLLALLPSLVGVLRLLQWTGLTVEPLPVRPSSPLALILVIHVVAVIGFGLLAPLQLSALSHRQNSTVHLRLGWLVWFSAVVAATTGLVLSLSYPHGPHHGLTLLLVRLLVAVAMLGCLAAGLAAVVGRQIATHRAWMIRAYALGMGAGTQVVTHVPLILWPELAGETSRTLCMTAGWVINLVVAEAVIRPRRRPERASSFHP